MKPHASLTTPDDIPPVHVLEAAETQDRKETEDLLAGFDRPGRGPKKAPAERDFVDYYAKKKNGGAEAGPTPGGRNAPTAPRAVFVPRQIDVETMVKPRKTRGLPPWLGWVAVGLAMLVIGGAVAFVATDEQPSAGTATAASISALTAVPMISPRDVVPPPTPAEPTTAEPTTATTTTTAVMIEPVASEVAPAAPPPSMRPTARRDPRNAPSAAVSAAHPSTTPSPSADRKPPPRDDFIRDL